MSTLESSSMVIPPLAPVQQPKGNPLLWYILYLCTYLCVSSPMKGTRLPHLLVLVRDISWLLNTDIIYEACSKG